MTAPQKTDTQTRSARRAAPRAFAWRLWALVPLLLLAGLAALMLHAGDTLIDDLGNNPPSRDQFAITRVLFDRDEIRIQLTNPQREDVEVAAVSVDNAIVPWEIDGSRTFGRLDRRAITVPYQWVENEPYTVGVTSSTGIQTTFDVPAAVRHEGITRGGVWAAILIGLLVGVAPIALGLLWLPALRRASDAWIATFMALTAGLLVFLAVDALQEALDQQTRLPGAFGGFGLVLLGVAASYLLLSWISYRFSGRAQREAGRSLAPLQLALLVAIGIGLHNLGEGLAIGSSFALGELALGLVFVIGFMVHNITEGLAIAAPLARTPVAIARLLGFALVAGLPAVAGVLLGRYVVSDVMGVVFFGLAVGAALQVVTEVSRFLRRTSPDGKLLTGRNAAGFVAGLLVMYVTGLLVG